MPHVMAVIKTNDERCTVIESYLIRKSPVHLVRCATGDRVMPADEIKITHINNMPVRYALKD